MKMTDWEFNMMDKLFNLADSFGFHASRVRKPKGDQGMSDIIIKIDEHFMTGFNINSPLSVKPFKLFPQNVDMGLDEIEEYFEDIKSGKDFYSAQH